MKHGYRILTTTLLFGFYIFLSGCGTTGDMVSESHNPGMTKIVYNIEVNASKSKVWEVLADYTSLDWTHTVTSTRFTNDIRGAVGMTRHCELEGGGHIVERITDWKEGREYTYVIDEASDPITTDSYVVWRLHGDEDQSQVTFEVHYQLKYGFLGDIMNSLMVKNKFSKQIIVFMGELKAHVEKQA